jgi:hypothetical protein
MRWWGNHDEAAAFARASGGGPENNYRGPSRI